jgi:hypothetical protein
MAHPHRIAPAWSHNSAPDVILAAVSQRTTPLRVEVVLAPIRPPLHIATPMAPLDMLSPGLVDARPRLFREKRRYTAPASQWSNRNVGIG